MRSMAKLILIGGLVLVLLLPLLALQGLVHERMARAQEVRSEIAAASARSQRIVGPLLVLSIEHLTETVGVGENEEAELRIPVVRKVEQRILTPRRQRMEHGLSTQWRGRALFRVPLFHDQGSFQVDFDLPDLDRQDQRLAQARVVLGLGDNRGLDSIRLTWQNQALEIEPGSTLAWLAQGVHAALPVAALRSGPLSVSGQFGLFGTVALDWLPLADDTEIEARGDWPHPGFRGASLPRSREVSTQGFEATWRQSRLANTAPASVQRCPVEQEHCAGLNGTGFGVELVEPVDRYRMSERALKYALLQLLLVFGTVFVIEALRERSVHPMHYGLTGAALAMFFLLLLALSEHLGFAPAYLIAAIACVALIGSYLGPVLGSRRLGLLGAGLLAGLYALLYGLLKSEDYALLMGALFLFGFLAAVMLGTRHLDWDRLGERVKTRIGSAPPPPQ